MPTTLPLSTIGSHANEDGESKGGPGRRQRRQLRVASRTPVMVSRIAPSRAVRSGGLGRELPPAGAGELGASADHLVEGYVEGFGELDVAVAGRAARRLRA